MPPIRALFFMILVIMLFMYGAILFIGGYEQGNGLAMNSTLANNYNALTSNSALPQGVFGNNTGLFEATNNLAKGINNTASSCSSVIQQACVVVNSVSLVLGFLTTIPTILGAIINFIAVPLSAFGIPLGYAQIIVSAIFVGIISLAIISALFLFPI